MQPDLALLDNPIWHALNGRLSHFAEKEGDLAKKFPAAVTKLAGIPQASDDYFRALGSLLSNSTEVYGILSPTPISIPSSFIHLVRQVPTIQMILQGPLPSNQIPPGVTIDTLSAADAVAMDELARLTEPGPFGLRTHELGIYLGIHNPASGRLAAMAGQRMRLPGLMEVSAVCTHPEHRRKGYARMLMIEVMRRHRETAPTDSFFLHVRADNQAAIAVYEALGFHKRAVLQYYLLRRPDTAPLAAPH